MFLNRTPAARTVAVSVCGTRGTLIRKERCRGMIGRVAVPTGKRCCVKIGYASATALDDSLFVSCFAVGGPIAAKLDVRARPCVTSFTGGRDR